MHRGSKLHKALNRNRWRGVRKQVLERDGHRCRACGKPGRLECDHRIPLHLGGDPYELDNIQALCVSCHIAKTRLENRRKPTPSETKWAVFVAKLA